MRGEGEPGDEARKQIRLARWLVQMLTKRLLWDIPTLSVQLAAEITDALVAHGLVETREDTST